MKNLKDLYDITITEDHMLWPIQGSPALPQQALASDTNIDLQV